MLTGFHLKARDLEKTVKTVVVIYVFLLMTQVRFILWLSENLLFLQTQIFHFKVSRNCGQDENFDKEAQVQKGVCRE